MSNPATENVTKINPVLNQAVIKGKILNARFYNQKHYTEIVTPAIDEYSKPSNFVLSSSTPLGTPQSLVNVTVSLSGFVRTFQYTDKNTGEIKEGKESSVYLNVIE